MKKYLLSLISVFVLTGLQINSSAQNTYLMCATDTVTDTSGTIFDSGGQNGLYLPNEDCTLLVSPSNGTIIILNFQNFQSELNYDFLHVYDGPDVLSPEVLSISGDTLPGQIVCTSGQMLLVWHSDFTVSDSGFACTWNALGCPCDTLSGTVYNDLNSNCLFDAGEEITGMPVSINDGGNLHLVTNSDSSGRYSISLPVSLTYNISVNAAAGFNGRYAPSCPASGTRQVLSLPSTGNDFGLTCIPGYDFSGNVTGWRFRPGFIATACVFVYNHRCIQPAGTIDLIFDTNLTPLPDTVGIGYTVSGNTVTFPIDTSLYAWSFCIPVYVSTAVNSGDSVCVDMVINPVAGDSFPTDNAGTFCFPVRNSWDPNDKYVVPNEAGPQGAILPNTPLTYTVRFQNTGSADAVNIYILDTLDADLDATTLEVVGFSHSMYWTLMTGNIVRFSFDNINLPDSNTNEQASHGYVMYRIHPKNNVLQLSEIKNSASIYFDFNPPVYTNQTLNTIDYFLTVKNSSASASDISVYPNPADGKCYLYFKDNRQRTINISDIAGRFIDEFKSTSTSLFLNIENYPAGVYLISVEESNGKASIRLVIAR